jgi:hypothetical protein
MMSGEYEWSMDKLERDMYGKGKEFGIIFWFRWKHDFLLLERRWSCGVKPQLSITLQMAASGTQVSPIVIASSDRGQEISP